MSRNRLLSSAIASVLAAQFAVPAMAQQASQAPAAETELEEIVVVGTQIRGVSAVGTEPIVLSSTEMQQTGLANTADILRRLPQVQTAANNAGQQGGTANQGYNGAQVETINLRGLGASATLILLDGRRVVGQGGAATNTDANQIPLGALERLEVLTDGASAVYGSDAVAGVVNFVTRRDFEGIEATVRSDDQSGGDQIGVTLVGGTTWDSLGGLGKGNVLVTYEHLDRDAFKAYEVPRLRSDLRPLGGPDMRIGSDSASVGFSPNIISQGVAPNTTIPRALNYTYWGVPSGDGTGLTSADLRLNDPNLVDAAKYTDWTGEQVRDQFTLFINQELSDTFEVFANLTYTDRETTSEVLAGTVRIPLAGTPYLIADLPPNQIVQYSALKDGSKRTFNGAAETWGAVVGLRMQLPGEWEGEVFYNYGRNEQCDSCVDGNINLAAMTAQVRAGNINPLSSDPLTAQQMDAVYGKSRFESRTTLDQFAAKFNGALFELPAGPLRAAVGAEYREESNANRNESRTGATNELVLISDYGSTKYERDITSVFLELNAPLLDSLVMSAAVRYDDYSDVGDTTNPRLGLTWDVTDHFSLQGTWGTSFRAPSVTDANPNAVASGSALVVPNYDDRITNGVLPAGIFGPFGLTNSAIMLGSNPDLVPEEADTWTIGANWKQDGFNIGLTYWDIKYDNQILFPGSIPAYIGATPTSAPDYSGWGSLIIPINNPVTCNNSDLSTADPVLQGFIESVNYDFLAGGGDYSTLSTLPSDFCKVNVLIDSRIQNVGSVHMSGLDFNTSYSNEIGEVSLLAQLALTYYLQNEISTGPGIPADDKIGVLFDPPSVFELQGTAGLTALWKGFDGTLTARYLDGMTATGQLQDNGLPGAPDKDLSAYVQFDVSLGYSAEFAERRFGFKGWRALLAISNVTDEEPDFFTPSGDPPNSWSFKYGLPFGRTYSAQLTGRF